MDNVLDDEFAPGPQSPFFQCLTQVNSPSVAGYFHPEGGALVPTQDEISTEDDEPSEPSDIDAAADVFDTLLSDDDDIPQSPPRSPIPPSYEVGDNVYAKWGPSKMYLAHVTRATMTGGGPLYDVYFLDDGEVKRGLVEDDLSPCTSTYPKRGEMIDRVFYCDGDHDFNPGQWKVRRIEGNTYQCVRLTGTGVNLESFDIGYVIKTWVLTNEDERERGPPR